MIQGKRGLFSPNLWQQLQGSIEKSQEFPQAVLPIMTSDDGGLESESLRHLAHLIRVARRQHYLMPAGFKFTEDRPEERNVRGIVEVDPYPTPDRRITSVRGTRIFRCRCFQSHYFPLLPYK